MIIVCECGYNYNILIPNSNLRLHENNIMLFSEQTLYKNLGPVWRAFCLASMKIDIPVDPVRAIKEQADWEKKRQKASSKENLHKRYNFTHLDC